MKRACIVRHGYYPSDPRVRKEARTLQTGGWEVDVVCLGTPDEKPREDVEGVRVYRLPLRHRRAGILWYVIEYGLSFALSFVRLTSLYLRRKHKIVQINTMPDFLVFVSLIPKLFGAKIVLDMHEAVPELLRSKYNLEKNHPGVKLAQFVQGLSVRFADHVIAVNGPILDLYASHGLPLRKATVVPNVPDEGLFDYRKYSPHRAGRNGFIIISHGSVLRRYGFHLLIKAIADLGESAPGARLVVLGNGEYLRSLRKLTESLALEERVTFLEQIPLEEVPAVISEVDAGAVPVLDDEFTRLMAPNKLFEYVAMRKPVVATRTTGIQSYFDGSCVMFFEPGNQKDLARCILELYQNPSKREELVENAWRRYQKIRWKVTRKTYLAIFEGLLQSQDARLGLKSTHSPSHRKTSETQSSTQTETGRNHG